MEASLIQIHQENEDSDVTEEREKVSELKDSSAYPVIIDNLHKSYDDKVAVTNVSLALANNECFGLLGPNGAGKTTIISICTGLFMPTSGTAYVGGFDVRNDMDSIHQIMGVCPQFDTLHDILTTKETLLFYCRLKGCSKDDEEELAMKHLKSVGLESCGDVLVKELSGGMKRRLSVAVSLVGDPAVLFLDEPTTGLDPESRRQLWDVLLQVKVGKCMILTTHSMEEADILCTRIGIISRGTMKCLGSNIRLKNKFGAGYSFKINFNPEKADLAKEFVKKILPTAELQESFPGNFTYRIHRQDFVMSSTLQQVLSCKDEYGIRDWGISQTTLEDVFLNIVKNDESTEDVKKR